MPVLLPLIFLAIIYFTAFYVGHNFEYKKVYWLFEFFHLLSGFLVASFWANFIENNVHIILLTLLVGVLWELWEFWDKKLRLPAYINKVIGKFKFQQPNMTYNDTFLDLLLDIGGAALWIWIF